MAETAKVNLAGAVEAATAAVGNMKRALGEHVAPATFIAIAVLASGVMIAGAVAQLEITVRSAARY